MIPLSPFVGGKPFFLTATKKVSLFYFVLANGLSYSSLEMANYSRYSLWLRYRHSNLYNRSLYLFGYNYHSISANISLLDI